MLDTIKLTLNIIYGTGHPVYRPKVPGVSTPQHSYGVMGSQDFAETNVSRRICYKLIFLNNFNMDPFPAVAV